MAVDFFWVLGIMLVMNLKKIFSRFFQDSSNTQGRSNCSAKADVVSVDDKKTSQSSNKGGMTDEEEKEFKEYYSVLARSIF